MESSSSTQQRTPESLRGSLATPVIHTVEMHTGGEPVRIVVSGYPEIKGATILDKRRYVRQNLDNLRLMLMHEPRGYDGMYGALLVEKDLPEADMAVLFMHNEGYSTMCGHATIALGRYAVDHGVIPAISPVTSLILQCPCGPVKLSVQYEDGCSGNVSFQSVPSFAVAVDQSVDVPGHGRISYDLSYGGAFYAFVEAGSVGLDLNHTPTKTCMELAGSVTDVLRQMLSISHPGNSDLAFLYGTILYSESGREEGKPEQLLCIFAERQVDRSPCGSGVTAKIALDWHKGRISIGSKKRLYQNPRTGSVFSGRLVREERLSSGSEKDQLRAVVVEVGGKGNYTGEAKFWVEQEDDIGRGFLL